MANYTGTYTNDFQIKFINAELPVHSLVNDERIGTSKEFDNRFLPSVFKAHLVNFKPVCEIVSGTRTLRQAKVQYDPVSYLIIPCPFIPGTALHDSFFEELKSNDAVLTLEKIGEHIDGFYTRLFVQKRIA